MRRPRTRDSVYHSTLQRPGRSREPHGERVVRAVPARAAAPARGACGSGVYSGRAAVAVSASASSSSCLVEALEKIVCGQLDFLVTPLGRTVAAGDQTRSMDAAKVSVDECVAALGLVACALGQAQVPFRVFVPGVRFQECVLIVRSRLNLAPVAVEDVLASSDEAACVCDCALIERVGSHEMSMKPCSSLVGSRRWSRPNASGPGTFNLRCRAL